MPQFLKCRANAPIESHFCFPQGSFELVMSHLIKIFSVCKFCYFHDPSHQDLRCLQILLFSSMVLKC